MIQIQGLRKQYGATTACAIEQLSVKTGEHVGLVGNNGAGKTTLLSLILDLIKADSGEVQLMGRGVHTYEDWKHDVAAYLDEYFIIDYLRPGEYLLFIAKLRGISADEMRTRLSAISPFFPMELLDEKKLIRDLSKGNKKRVGIASAIIAHAQLLILDEPFANLDPSAQLQLRELIAEQSAEQTIIISSHDLTHVHAISDRIIMLQDGLLYQDLETKAYTLEGLQSFFMNKSE